MIEGQALLDERYRVLQPLGSGGMSEVYLCRDEVLGREVALKVLREQYASDEEFVERFAREARSAASLAHPNIASVYDLGRSHDGRYFIVMEYVRGGTLAQYLAQEEPMAARTAAAVAGQIARALGAAHEKGVVHRDIKPQNVLVSGEADVKLADFGIARAAAASSVSHTGHVLGTPSYMSPEQAMGERATPQSDLYALGCVLYEMLTGELPFDDADTPVAVSLKHVRERPHQPTERNPEVPTDMDAVVMRLLSKDPAGRYESAEALADDLARLEAGLPPVAVSTDAAMPAGGVGGRMSSVALLSATADGLGAEAADERPTDSMRTRRRSRRRKLLVSAAPLVLVFVLGATLVGLSRGPGDGGVIGSLDGAPGNALGEARSMVEDAGQALFGPQQAKVPEVEGLSEERARQRLAERGFGTQIRPQHSSAGDAGTVLEQSAPGGARAQQGSKLLLAVGEGPATTSGSAASGSAQSSSETAGQASANEAATKAPVAVDVPGGANSASGSSASGSSVSDSSSGDPGNGGDEGSSIGAGGFEGDYSVPPATDDDRASPPSASAPLHAPDTGAPAQTPSQSRRAPASSYETPETPASLPPREAVAEPLPQKRAAEPWTEEAAVADSLASRSFPFGKPLEEASRPAASAAEDLQPPYEPSEAGPVVGSPGDQYD